MWYVLRFLARILQLGGVLALVYTAFVVIRAQTFQAYEKRVFDRELRSTQLAPSPDSVPPRSAVSVPPRFPISVPHARHGPVPRPDSLIGRIEIPHLDLSTMILEGDEERQLQLGAGHVPGTALPGGAGNVVIAAHRDTFFRPLENISRNDQIVLTTLAGSFRYIVEYVAITDPDNARVMRASAEPSLTLITCYPFSFVGPAPKRFVVHAIRAR